MIGFLGGAHPAIRRCAHKRRRLVLTGTWVPAKDDFFLKISFSPDAQGRKGGMHHDVWTGRASAHASRRSNLRYVWNYMDCFSQWWQKEKM